MNDVPYCCGRPLKLVDNTYVCEFCGGEYDAEDEEEERSVKKQDALDKEEALRKKSKK